MLSPEKISELRQCGETLNNKIAAIIKPFVKKPGRDSYLNATTQAHRAHPELSALVNEFADVQSELLDDWLATQNKLKA